jgi:eukaryotic-like serine/threonine-protein kinase
VPLTTRLGKYEIVKQVGKGATAAVFLAYDPFAQRSVAIKAVEAAAFQNGEAGRIARKQFVTEASFAGKLKHPHIVEIYDAVADADPCYIVMEYMPGGTLEPNTRADNLLPIPEVVGIIFKCCHALDYAHRQGVIHRDLKPANLLRGEGTDVKISDFGAALMLSSDQSYVAGIGSPAYMSPEQIVGVSLGPQSDMFALGVVFYQLLTGHLPFDGTNNLALAYQIQTAEPPPPSTLRPEVPDCIDAVIGRALRKTPGERFPSWQEFAHALAAAFRDDDVAALRDSQIGDSEKFALLRPLSFFKEFADVELWETLRFSRWQHINRGDVLMRENDPGDNFSILIAGQVKVTKQRRLLDVLAVGECFGEMAYLSPERAVRSADVIAAGEGMVITIATDALAKASPSTRHSFDRAFLRILVERLDLANLRLTSAAL